MKIVGLPYEPQPQLRRRRKTRWRMKTTWGGPTVLPLSLSLSISLSLTLPLPVAIPVPRCACGGAARRRGPAAGMRGKSKGVKSMGATGKMFEGTSYDFAESCADAGWKTMCLTLLRENAPRGLGRAQDRSFGGRAPRRGGTLSNV